MLRGVNNWNEEDDFISQIKELLGLSNIETNSIEINSVKDSFRCELWDTGTFWVRPYYATCVDNSENQAWECIDKAIYQDLDYKWLNSCLKKEFVKHLNVEWEASYQWFKHM